MNVDEYKEKLIAWASFLNQILTEANHAAYANLGNKVRLLLDENYEIYINANNDERKEIRQIVKDDDRNEKYVHEGGSLPKPFRYRLNGYGISAIKQLEETGNKIWLTRGLVATSMLDGIHYRPDDEEHLARLYGAAKEKDIDPNPVFQLVSVISNTEPTEPGEISTSELIGNIPNKAHKIVDEFRKIFLVDKDNE